MRMSKPFLLFQVFVVLFLLFLFFGKPNLKKNTKLPELGIVPSFQLKTSEGGALSEKDLRGKIWVADFIFTSCGGPCPMMTRQMQWLQRSFKGESQIQLVSVTVDPSHDSPEVLKEYAAEYSANPEQWHFLTGPEKEIRELVIQGFKLGMVDGEPSLHSTRFVLVDKELRIRGYYDAVHDEERNALVRDMGRLLSGSEPSL